jgi:acyl dehydratase
VPLNRDFIGRRFVADTSFVVGREHIRQFAAAIQDDNPLSQDVDAAKAAGYVDLVAPPTFLTALVMWRPVLPMDDPELGLDYSLVVHGEQRFTLRRPVVAGDDIVVSVTVTNIRDVGRNELLTTEHEFVTTAGEPVGTALSTLVSRGTAAVKES